MLSRLEPLMANYVLSYNKIAQSQERDPELQQFLKTNTGMQFKQVLVPGATQLIYCDTTMRSCCPYIPGYIEKGPLIFFIHWHTLRVNLLITL